MCAGYYDAVADEGENALRLDGVGNLTTVEYVQVYKNANRGFRINGGDVGLKWVLSTNSQDVGFRLDDDIDDWQGTGQFWIINKDITADGAAIESRDGSNPILSNLTVTGIGLNSMGEAPDGVGIRIRNDGNGRIYNTVVTGVDKAVHTENAGSIASDDSFHRNSASFDNTANSGTGFNSSAREFNPTSGDYVANNYNSLTPFTIVHSYVDTSTTNSIAAGPLDAYFTDVNFVGAVDAANDWTDGWTVNLDGTLNTLFSNSFDISDFKVYPNPVVDILKIDSNAQISNVALYDATGKRVFENSSFDSGKNEINMSKFQKGLYFLQLFSNGSIAKTLKVIKR